MNNTIKKVFLIIGLLVLIFILWQVIFGDGGLIKTAYNGIAGVINAQYEKVAGSGRAIMPEWDETGAEDDGTADMNADKTAH